MVLAIDFDGTLVHKDAPLPGAKDILWQFHDLGYYILIHSCNNSGWIRRVLNDNDMYYDEVWEEKGKPIADWYIDDRAVPFEGNWEAILRKLHGNTEAEPGTE